jgi:hypothetical protein
MCRCTCICVFYFVNTALLAYISAGSSEIHKLVNSIWNKEELPEQWKESIIVPIYKKGDKTD